METLTATAPHYVRCLKPNALKMPAVFDNDLVLNQLRYAGMMETIKIRYWISSVRLTLPLLPHGDRKAGFPVRSPFDVFWRNYRSLIPQTRDLVLERENTEVCIVIQLHTINYHYFVFHKMVKKALKILLEGLKAQGLTNATDLQIGKTKIFMRDSQVSLSRSATSQHMIY
jgi:myosin heavy subunit